MHKDQAVGVGLIIISIIVIIVYALLMFGPYIPIAGINKIFTMSVSIAALQVTAFIAIAIIFGILAWVGYTLATTPPPKPIEEIEKEIEEELKKLEEELKKEQEKEATQQAQQTGSESKTQ